MDEALAQLTQEWMTKSLHNLQTARIVADSLNGPLDTAIYHCQQAAEKAVKGWLTSQSVTFEKTHDIRRLVKQAEKIESNFSRLTAAAEVLTPYATAFRYPGLTFEPMPTREEFDAALKDTQTIYDFVLNLLPKEVQP